MKSGRGSEFPVYPIPTRWWESLEEPPPSEDNKLPTSFDLLVRHGRHGLLRRYGKKPPDEAVTRLEHELAVVRSVGYADYFLIVREIIEEAQRRGIPWLARGSAADSLLCYCLGISNVCPLRFGLMFERFLNPERVKFSKLADIDLDFPWDQREEIVQWVFDRFGPERVAMIGGFSVFHGRAAIADFGKVFGLSEEEVRAVTRLLPRVTGPNIERAVAENPRTRELRLDEEPFDQVLRLSRHFEGFPRHPMMHPCGLVVGNRPLSEVMPLIPSARGRVMTQFDMEAVEELGFVKIDLLGQAGLAVLRDVTAALRLRGVEFDPEMLRRDDWRDSLTWEMISSGGARGVHHIESPAMTSLLVQSNCRDIDCLCAVVSVIRPGAADEGKKLAFTRRQQGFEVREFLHPSLEQSMADTHGLLVFEEHILHVARDFAHMNLGRADVLRRALVKNKDPEQIAALGEEFANCARAVGRSEAEIRVVWERLSRFCGYMFNKAHSAAYAVEAFEGAWLKARYPAEYMAAVLENARGFYSPLFYAVECRRLGIRLFGPCVNQSGVSFQTIADTSNRGVIRVPLHQIKGLSSRGLERILTERSEAKFRSVKDFLQRADPDPSDLELLVAAGALDCFGMSRSEIFWSSFAPRVRSDELPGLWSGQTSARAAEGLSLPTLDDPDAKTRAWEELRLLGFPVTLDPFETLSADVRWETYCPAAQIIRFAGERVTVCGLTVADRLNHTLRGDLMAYVTLADPTGYVEATFFPRQFQRHGNKLELERVLALTGVVRAFDNHRGAVLEVTDVRLPRRK